MKLWECVLKINKAKIRQGKGESPNDNDLREEAGAIAIGILNALSQKLDHLLFDTRDGWYRAESMNHPTLKLVVHVSSEDYTQMQRKTPHMQPSTITVVTDTGAQSCLW